MVPTTTAAPATVGAVRELEMCWLPLCLLCWVRRWLLRPALVPTLLLLIKRFSSIDCLSQPSGSSGGVRLHLHPSNQGSASTVHTKRCLPGTELCQQQQPLVNLGDCCLAKCCEPSTTSHVRVQRMPNTWKPKSVFVEPEFDAATCRRVRHEAAHRAGAGRTDGWCQHRRAPRRPSPPFG